MSIDGGLRPLLAQHMPEAHWQSVETWAIAAGVPDANYCFPGGIEGWVECKLTKTDTVKNIAPAQIGWAERRARVGGRIWLAVRQKRPSGPRTTALDSLFLYRGVDVRAVSLNGLSVRPVGVWRGGVARWDWAEIRRLLTL